MAVPVILTSPEPDDAPGSESQSLGFNVELDLDLGLQLQWQCPTWCVFRPNHADAVDTPLLRHRSVARLIETAHGGVRTDRAGRAIVSTQAEQLKDNSQPPLVVHAVEINGDEYAANLTPTEARKVAAHLTEIANVIDPPTR